VILGRFKIINKCSFFYATEWFKTICTESRRVQLNIATKRIDKKLFRSKSLSTITDLSVTCQIPCKLELTCCCFRSWPFYSLLSGFQPMTMVSYPAFCFQPEFQRFNSKQQEDICKMQAALAHTWNGSKFVASSYTTHDHTSTIVPREHVCSGPIPIIPLGHLRYNLISISGLFYRHVKQL